MAEDSEYPVYPVHYPLDGAFSDFLCWHMDYWGTRPTGNTYVNGEPWSPPDFRYAAFAEESAKETIRVGMRSWRGKGSAPDSTTAALILKALFGGNPIFTQWRKDFERAYKDSKGPGKNSRTKQFPDPPPVPTVSPPIPRLTPYFTGRDKERDVLVEAILAEGNASRAILIQGGPGMGKTELTKGIAHDVRIATHFGARRWFVRLETANSADALKDAILRELGDPQLGLQSALNYLAMAPSLIVLDNLEAPWESREERLSTEVVLAELCAIDSLVVISSFRGLEKVGGTRWLEYHLDGLPPSAAADLFVSIAGPWVSDDPNIERFIDALGGIPLAIELVARRAYGRRSLVRLWEEWIKIGAELCCEPDGSSERLTSLPHSIRLSLLSNRVTPIARRLLSYLGHSPNGLCKTSLEALIGEGSFDAEDCLYRSGLSIDRDGRLDLLPPIREFMRHNLPLSSDDESKWATNFLNLLYTFGNINPDYIQFHNLINDISNIESAILYQCSHIISLDVARIMPGFTTLCGLNIRTISPIKDLFKNKIFSDDPCKLSEKANSFLGLAGIQARIFQYEDAKINYGDAIEIYERLSDVAGQAQCYRGIAEIADNQRQRDQSFSFYRMAFDNFTKIGDPVGVSYCLMEFGFRSLSLEANGQAYESFAKAEKLFDETKDVLGKAYCLRAQACSLSDCGNHRNAARLCYEAATIFTRLGYKHLAAKCYFEFAIQAEANRCIEDAYACFERAAILFLESDDLRGEIESLIRLRELVQYEGATQSRTDYADILKSTISLRMIEINEAESLSKLLMENGNIAISMRQFGVAESTFLRLLALHKRFGDKVDEAHCFMKLGQIAIESPSPDVELARQLYSIACNAFLNLGYNELSLECSRALGSMPFSERV